MMSFKLFFLLSISAVFIVGCASSEKNKERSQPGYSDLVELAPPEQENMPDSKVYIDSVNIIEHEGSPALLIRGNFPDGCTQLRSVSFATDHEVPRITLKAWRDPDLMCAQVLTPFSFIYRGISADQMAEMTAVEINGSSYSLD